MEGGNLARNRVHFLPDAQVRWAAPNVIGRVRSALPLRQGHHGSAPSVAPHAVRIVDRDAQIVAQLRTWNALRLVLVETGCPFTGEIDLTIRGNACQGRAEKEPSRISGEIV